MKRQTARRILIYTSLALFPVFFYYLSPALILQGASEGIVNGSFIMFSAMLIGSIFLGRLWCGWLCPGAGLGQLAIKVRNKPAPGGRWYLMKYLIFVPWIALIAILAVGAGGYSKVDPFYQTVYGISILAPGAIFVMVGVLSLIAGFDLGFGRRGFCHYACWMGPFNIIGSKIGDLTRIKRVHLKADPSKCIHCGACTRNCPMGLDVEKMVATGSMKHDECVLCMTCVDNCPKGAIR